MLSPMGGRHTRALAMGFAGFLGLAACAEGSSVDTSAGSSGVDGSGAGATSGAGAGGSAANASSASAGGAGTGTGTGAGAGAGTGSGSGSGSGGSGAGGVGGGSGSGGGSAESCAPGEFMTGFGATDAIVCTPMGDLVGEIVNADCAVYLGWRDECEGCASAPVKWGHAGAQSCLNGAGTDDTCTTPTLGGDAVDLFGLNPDGDVDGNDMLYTGFHCGAGDDVGSPGPCDPGELVTAIDGGTLTCTPATGAVLGFIRESCSIYLGWRDSCNACTTTPAKWGRANDTECEDGAGADNACSTASLGGEMVRLFGLNPDGDVGGDDKLSVALHCLDGAAEGGSTSGACPPGQFVVGTHGGGDVDCESPAPLVAEYFNEHCTLFLGWQDECEGCGTPPTKWGRVTDGACANGAGTDDTCTTPVLGGSTVRMFGLNPDGDVDGNDTLYVGFECL